MTIPNIYKEFRPWLISMLYFLLKSGGLAVWCLCTVPFPAKSWWFWDPGNQFTWGIPTRQYLKLVLAINSITRSFLFGVLTSQNDLLRYLGKLATWPVRLVTSCGFYPASTCKHLCHGKMSFLQQGKAKIVKKYVYTYIYVSSFIYIDICIYVIYTFQ